jgi:hypothetical protein
MVSTRAMVIARGWRRLIVKDLSPLARRAFRQPVKCGWSEYPNVAAIRWLDNSAKPIVAAEIVHHSNCDSFGPFRAYEIDWRSMKILASFGQLEAKRRFHEALGFELRDAPDKCIRSPKKCWVSTNHPGAG